MGDAVDAFRRRLSTLFIIDFRFRHGALLCFAIELFSLLDFGPACYQMLMLMLARFCISLPLYCASHRQEEESYAVTP